MGISVQQENFSVQQKSFHVPRFINARRVSASQYGITFLCGLVMFLDGFDTQSISYISPLMAKEWGLPREMLGPIFSSALTGLMVGYLFLSSLSDKFGHRRMMLISIAAFGFFTLVTVFTTNVTELIGLRFVTGMGLGSAIPSAVALTGEYSPKRLRATFVLAIYCGFSLGFVAAGAVAAWMLPLYGWRPLLWVGAISPLALAVFIYWFLPESIDFLVRNKADPRRIWTVLHRIDPLLTSEPPGDFLTDLVERKSAVGSLFQSGRTFGTLLLWVVFFLNLAEFYALQSWLPAILTSLNYPLNTIALATSLTTVGGILAAFVVGPAMDRLAPFGSLAVLYFVGVFFVALTGPALSSPEWVLLTATLFAGFCISGGQKSLVALSAIFYPAPIRSTGVGWALGIGRLGAIGGPLLVGVLLAWNLQPASIFYAAALPMLICGTLIAILGRWYGKGQLRQ